MPAISRAIRRRSSFRARAKCCIASGLHPSRPMDPERLSILVDENVAYARESFGRVGTVRVLPGRRITAADVERVDVLIVRSVTRVNEALLAGSSVKFVGTATIGCDHVDVEYLRGRGIAFASAPGSNATS